MKNCVIYKITNPSNHSYVGKTEDWNRRYKRYKSLDTKGQPSLHKSFLKYKFENHRFEILMQNVPKCYLSQMEIWWIAKLNTFNNGLNCTIGGDGGSHFHRKETKQKISKSKKGHLVTKETRYKISQTNIIKNISKGLNNPFFGKYHSENSIMEMKKSNEYRSVKVLCHQNNKIYSSCNEAAKDLKVYQSSIGQCINGKRNHTGGYTFEKINV